MKDKVWLEWFKELLWSNWNLNQMHSIDTWISEKQDSHISRFIHLSRSSFSLIQGKIIIKSLILKQFKPIQIYMYAYHVQTMFSTYSVYASIMMWFIDIGSMDLSLCTISMFFDMFLFLTKHWSWTMIIIIFEIEKKLLLSETIKCGIA